MNYYFFINSKINHVDLNNNEKKKNFKTCQVKTESLRIPKHLQNLEMGQNNNF